MGKRTAPFHLLRVSERTKVSLDDLKVRVSVRWMSSSYERRWPLTVVTQSGPGKLRRRRGRRLAETVAFHGGRLERESHKSQTKGEREL